MASASFYQMPWIFVEETMLLKNFISLVCLLGVCLLSNGSVAGEAPPLKTRTEKLSYSMGVSFVRDFQKMGMNMDFDALIQGIRDASSGRTLLLEEPEIRSLVNAFKFEKQQKQGNPRKPGTSP
jgi:hypothetical protein